MTTPIFIDGFEGQNTAESKIWSGDSSFIFGSNGMQQTYARNGGWAWRATATAASVGGGTTISSNILVASFYVYFVSLPAALAVLANIYDGTHVYALQYHQATGQFSVGIENSTQTDGNVTPAAGQWYQIDLLIKTSANPHTIDWQINGVPQTQFFNAVTATTLVLFEICDVGFTQTLDIAVDDVVLSYTSADYPIGPHSVVGYYVKSTSGTHSQTAGDLQTQASVNITNGDGSGVDLSETSPDLTTYIKQVVIRTTSYGEYVYNTAAAGNGTPPPLGVQQFVVASLLSGTTGTQKSQLYDGTTASDMYATVSPGVTTAVYYGKCWATSPSAGGWTTLKLQKLRIRWGFAGVITGSPFISWTMLQVAYPNPVLHPPELSPMYPLLGL